MNRGWWDQMEGRTWRDDVFPPSTARRCTSPLCPPLSSSPCPPPSPLPPPHEASHTPPYPCPPGWCSAAPESWSPSPAGGRPTPSSPPGPPGRATPGCTSHRSIGGASCGAPGDDGAPRSAVDAPLVFLVGCMSPNQMLWEGGGRWRAVELEENCEGPRRGGRGSVLGWRLRGGGRCSAPPP